MECGEALTQGCRLWLEWKRRETGCGAKERSLPRATAVTGLFDLRGRDIGPRLSPRGEERSPMLNERALLDNVMKLNYVVQETLG